MVSAPPETWQDRLAKFKAAGFNTTDLYVPWNLISPKMASLTSLSRISRLFCPWRKTMAFTYFPVGPLHLNKKWMAVAYRAG